MILAFEMKYDFKIKSRMDSLENNLAAVQADMVNRLNQNNVAKKLNQKLAMAEESHFDEQGLYPNSLSSQNVDKIFCSTLESTHKDRNGFNLSSTLKDIKKEQI